MFSGLSRQFSLVYCSLVHSSNFCQDRSWENNRDGCLNGQYGTELGHFNPDIVWFPDMKDCS